MTFNAGWKPKLTTSELSGAVNVTVVLAGEVVGVGVDLGVDHVAGDVERGTFGPLSGEGACREKNGDQNQDYSQRSGNTNPPGLQVKHVQVHSWY